ncbi:MAG: GNAT family N-acetyltransferase [Acidobacteriota bacterium]|nr:GNAT family N-acetyltransferase [Acidobacteriota bacterium]
MAVVAGEVPPETVRPLRAEVLRPGLPADLSAYPGDDDPDSRHVAVRHDPEGPVVAVGSLLADMPPAFLAEGPTVPAPATAERWWRIRGMATAADRRGEGLGRQVLDALLDAAARAGGGVVWCNARAAALDFYLRAGFEPVGEVFEEPLIGPHRAMRRRVPPA